ncbi:CocE/NonD family hydrolase C-terminal non-catalytic domain-containing protein, partial [Limosilactobacillus fermentum]
HHLEDGHQLELILFATDYLMTVRGNEEATYTIDPATVELRLPADFA